MLAGAEYICTAQLLRSIRALHILHRNAQRHQVTRRAPRTVDLTYLMVVVVAGGVLDVVVVPVCGLVVVVVGITNWRLNLTGPMGCATR